MSLYIACDWDDCGNVILFEDAYDNYDWHIRTPKVMRDLCPEHATCTKEP